MGITLESKKGKISLDMGYGAFLLLRKKVAELCSHEFGEHYDTIDKAPFFTAEKNISKNLMSKPKNYSKER